VINNTVAPVWNEYFVFPVSAQVLSVYSLYWYKRTYTDAAAAAQTTFAKIYLYNWQVF
jgi:hypothetical protein